jgi:hypothetical protein
LKTKTSESLVHPLGEGELDFKFLTGGGHLEKGISVTRVLVETNARTPKPVLGYFSLSCITIEAREWPGAPKGLPRQAVSAVLLDDWQWRKAPKA